MSRFNSHAILLVDDDENDLFFLTDSFSKAGVTAPIRIARDGKEAIEYFQGEGKFADRDEFPLPSLALIDFKLPHLTGLQVLQWIRRHHGLAPIVILFSSSESDADISAAYRAGANAYLVKPTRLSKMVEITKAIKDFWLILNRPPPEEPAAEPKPRAHHPHPTRKH